MQTEAIALTKSSYLLCMHPNDQVAEVSNTPIVVVADNQSHHLLTRSLQAQLKFGNKINS